MLMRRTLHLHSSSSSTLNPLFLLLLSLLSHHASSSTFIYQGCSQDKYNPNSPFQMNLNSLLSSILGSSSQASYSSFAVGNGTSSLDSAVYGLYQCRGDLNFPECTRCIQSVISQIELVCPSSFGASLQLDTCFIVYEHTDFLGKLDTSLRFKKCSKSASNDEEFLKRRDDVLAELQGAMGYRMSRSGLVEGYAQCLGDLNSGDCSACLSDAIDKLRSLCGSASAADVFLGQCYARFWASGYYDTPSGSNEDEVGKTVAIIIGVVAGLAVVIVLLSVCSKSLGRKA